MDRLQTELIRSDQLSLRDRLELRALGYDTLPIMGGGAAGALVTTPPASTALGGGGSAKSNLIPFRLATYKRQEFQQTWAPTLKTTQQQNTLEIKGSGLMGNLRLRVRADASANAATVAFAEDAPWNSLLQLQLSDANGQVVNIDGYSLFVANKCFAKFRGVNYLDQSSQFVQTAGSGGTGGTFEFYVDIPIVNNNRDLKGLLGNQSQTNSYKLVITLNASGNIYTTAPTTLPVVTIDVIYTSWAIPPAKNSAGTAQEQVPKHFGTINYLNAINNTTLPAPGALKHYLSNVGRDIRWMALIWRAGAGATPRATANAAMTSVNAAGNDTALQLKIGAIEPIDSTYDQLRAYDYEMYGLDAPNGVMVLPFNDDFLGYAGAEASGADFLHTQGISERNAYLQATYANAFTANASNSLTIVTADTEYRLPVTPQAAG